MVCRWLLARRAGHAAEHTTARQARRSSPPSTERTMMRAFVLPPCTGVPVGVGGGVAGVGLGVPVGVGAGVAGVGVGVVDGVGDGVGGGTEHGSGYPLGQHDQRAASHTAGLYELHGIKS